jgi:hypothetical protein
VKLNLPQLAKLRCWMVTILAISLALMPELSRCDIGYRWGQFGQTEFRMPTLVGNGTQVRTYDRGVLKYWDRSNWKYIRAMPISLYSLGFVSADESYAWTYTSNSITKNDLVLGPISTVSMPQNSGCTFSPNGEKVYAFHTDGRTLSAHNTTDGSELFSYTSAVNMDFPQVSPDGTLLLVPSELGYRIVDATTGQLGRLFPPTSQAGVMRLSAFSPVSDVVATFRSPYVYMNRISTGALICRIGSGFGFMNCIAFDQTGSRLAVGYRNNSSAEYTNIVVYDTSTGQAIRSFTGVGTITSLKFLETDSIISTKSIQTEFGESSPDSYQLHNLTSGFVGDYPEKRPFPISVHLDDTRGRLLGISSPGTLHILNASTGMQTQSLALNAYPKGFAVSPDGSKYVLGGIGTSGVYSSETHQLLFNLQHWTFTPWRFSFSNDGSKIACSSVPDSAPFTATTVHDASNGLLLRSFFHSDGSVFASFSEDSSEIIAGFGSQSLTRFSIATGAVIRRTTSPIQVNSNKLILNPSATVGYSIGQHVGFYRWNLMSTNDVTVHDPDPNSFKSAIALSPDGKVLAVASIFGLTFWDTSTMASLGTFRQECIPYLREMIFSADSSSIYAVRSDRSLIKFASPLAPIKGQVVFQNIATSSIQQVRFELLDSLGDTVQSWNSVNVVDDFVLKPNKGLKVGEYTLRAKAGTWLRKSEVFSLPQESSVTLSLVNGDCNSDNVVDLTDYSIIAMAFNSILFGDRWDERADLNQDNVVDLTDYIILATSFNWIGD